MSLRNRGNKLIVAAGDAILPFAESPSLHAISEGFINLIPIVLIGSICIVIANFPIPAFHDMLNTQSNGIWAIISQMITSAVADIIALAAMVSVSLSIAEQSHSTRNRETSIFVPLFTAMACFVIFFVWNRANFSPAQLTPSPSTLFSNNGGRAVFSGVFIAFTATKLFIIFDKLWQRLRSSRRHIIDSNYQLRVAIHSLFPMIATIVVFAIARVILDWLFFSTPFLLNLYGFLAYVVNEGGFIGVVLTEFTAQIFWLFGIHGTENMQLFLQPEYSHFAGTINVASQNLPDTAAALRATVVNKDFYNTFIELGGPGATIGMLLALFVFGSTARGKRIAHISVFPSIFNINGTILYGLPLVLNPFTLLPFLLAPTVIAAVSYLAFATGLVPPIINSVEWTMPLFFSGYLATGSLAGALLQLIGLAISFVFYAPFVVMTRDATERYQQRLFGQFKAEAVLAANNEQALLMQRSDAIGTLTRDLIAEIHDHFSSNNLPFFMVFQPKTNKKGEVAGAEALLRWTHPRFGPIPPDIVIELTDEAGVTAEFGRWVTRASLEEFVLWQSNGVKGMTLSINLNPHHIFIDEDFPDFLDSELTRLGIQRSLIELEITEHVAVGSGEVMQRMFRRLRALGVRLSIDDMGMGYSSLTYISDFGVNTVKVDISLIDKVDVDLQQQKIVSSVLDLAATLDLTVIIEGVETQAQVETLVKLGCCYFQGYYFSKPLLPKDFLDFVLSHGKTRLA